MQINLTHKIIVSLILLSIQSSGLYAEEIPTDTQVSQANNLSTQEYGVLISVPKYLMRNVNDDQNLNQANYEIWDRNHYPSLNDKDLKEVTVTGKAGPSGGVLVLQVEGNVAAIKSPISTLPHETIYWVDNIKTDRYPEDNHNYLVWGIAADKTFSVVLYIEGVENSGDFNDIKFIATVKTGGKEKSAFGETTVLETDLDVDSNNNEGLTFNTGNQTTGSLEEDRIENSIAPYGDWIRRPGKIVMVNDGFGDSVPDWADGFLADVSNPDAGSTGEPIKFVPMVIERKPPYTSNCTVKITYASSNPSRITKNNFGFPDNSLVGYQLPDEGAIRIWRKNNDSSSSLSDRIGGWIRFGGDVVENEFSMPWSEISDSDKAYLWVEAVKSSDTLADITVKAEITERDMPTNDNIRMTASRIKCEPITDETHALLTPYNPASIVTGIPAYFRIDVEPAEYPDSAINWTETGGGYAALDKLPSSGTNRFARFRQVLDDVRDSTIEVDVLGNYYTPPIFRFKKLGQFKSITTNIFVTSDPTTGNKILTDAQVMHMVDMCNKLLVQTGFQLNPIIGTWRTGNGSAFFSFDSSVAGTTQLISNSEITDGIRLVIVNDYDAGGNPHRAAGLTWEGFWVSVAASNTSTYEMGRVLAHEFGHSCGLDDIYITREYDGNSWQLDGEEKATREWSIDDWPEDGSLNSDPAYYARCEKRVPTTLTEYATRQYNLIHRQVMYGDVSSIETDFALGKVYGIIGGYNSDPEFTQAKVGVNDMQIPNDRKK